MEKVKHPCKELSIRLVPGLQNTSVWRDYPLIDAQLNLVLTPRRKVTTINLSGNIRATFLAKEPNKRGGFFFCIQVFLTLWDLLLVGFWYKLQLRFVYKVYS